jgi:hypothetical protein
VAALLVDGRPVTHEAVQSLLDEGCVNRRATLTRATTGDRE